MNMSRLKNVLFALACTGVAACADSTGPGNLGDQDAMRSLSLGLTSGGVPTLPFALTPSRLGTGGGGIDRIDVAINGSTQSMYALGLRVTYPVGTCVETIFVSPPPVNPGVQCTPPPLGLVLALWQTTSGSRPPGRMVLIFADVGTSSFSSNFGTLPAEGFDYTDFPAFAFHVNDREEFWMSVGGSLNSQVTASSETCDVPAPLFARTSSCNFATFTEAGQITFERFDFRLFGPGAPPPTMEITIPSQSLRGILQTISEIDPFPGGWDY